MWEFLKGLSFLSLLTRRKIRQWTENYHKHQKLIIFQGAVVLKYVRKLLDFPSFGGA